MATKKLIWFQHIHKSAGTSIVSMAKYNQIKFYEPNNNGNPRHKLGDPEAIIPKADIRYDKFWIKRLQKFIDNCIEQQIQFIGCEWGFPEIPLDDNRIFYLTCIRDPWARFVSNYSFDHHANPTRFPNLGSWMEPEYGYNKHNYYTRIFAGLAYQYSGPITETHFKIAKANLRKFDLVMVLEQSDCFQTLEIMLGWDYNPSIGKNATSKKVDLSDYRDEFYIQNLYDYQLYEEAQWLYKNQSKKCVLSKADQVWYNTLAKASSKDNYSLQLAHQLDKDSQKNKAVELHLYRLRRINSKVLNEVHPRLIQFPLNSYNQIEIVNLNFKVPSVIRILYHLSYLCYYTKYKHLGKQICTILLETDIKHSYRDHVTGTLKFYKIL